MNLVSGRGELWGNFYTEVKTGGIKIWSAPVYNYDTALQAVKTSGYSKNTCVIGITYGSLNEIISGYSYDEMQTVDTNATYCSMFGPLNLSKINDNPNIKILLFSDKSDKKNEIQALLDGGDWLPWQSFYNETFGTTIVGLIRK